MIKIGIICPSEIALRRFLPALAKLKDFKFVGVAIANLEEWDGSKKEIIDSEKVKAQSFTKLFGGKIFHSYADIINSKEIDAIYLPLPPALHYKWAKRALLRGKHVFIEKPATTSVKKTLELISIASEKNLALHENYMFIFHNQLEELSSIVNSGMIGDVRLYRISFGFPERSPKDFRYNKKLGGGALLDCGGYTIKYATILLGESAEIVYAISNYINKYDVDISGSAAIINKNGMTVQISFGMDNSYKCELEVWGSKGCLTTERLLTAPEGFIPEASIKIGNNFKKIELPEDDAFMKSIQHFQECIENKLVRTRTYNGIKKQARFVDDFIKKSKKNEDE